MSSLIVFCVRCVCCCVQKQTVCRVRSVLLNPWFLLPHLKFLFVCFIGPLDTCYLVQGTEDLGSNTTTNI